MRIWLARYSLKKFLEKQPDKLSTPTMLLAVNLQNFTVLQDYTQNKQAVIAALDHHFVAFPWQAHNYSWVSERFTTAFGTLMRVAQATVGHPGHKNMIWIGRGFPALNFANLQVDASSRVDNAVQQCVNALRFTGPARPFDLRVGAPCMPIVRRWCTVWHWRDTG